MLMICTSLKATPMTTKHQRHFTASLESINVSMEKIGFFRKLMEPAGHNDFNNPQDDWVVQRIVQSGGFVRPFSERMIADLEARLGFDVDPDTHRFFKRFGHIKFGSYESFTPAEIVEWHDKLSPLEKFPKKAVPILRQTGAGWITFRDTSRKKWGSISSKSGWMNYFHPQRFEQIYMVELDKLADVKVSQEGWFSSFSDGTNKFVERLRHDLEEHKIQFRPFNAPTIEHLEKELGVKFDASTRQCFERIGSINGMHEQDDDLDSLSPAEIIEAHEKILRHYPEMTKFVPWFYVAGDGGYVGRNLADNKIYAIYLDPEDASENSKDDWGRHELAEFFYFSMGDRIWR